jgi:hypothetical protein
VTDWATTDDVDTYTGATATDAEVTRAQAIVELFAGTTTDASDQGLISSRNLRLLKMAVAYQTAWMQLHPDVFTNVDIDSGGQDGVSYTNAHANAALLAPLAKRCVDRLTWRLAPLRVRRPRRRATDTGNRDSAAHDDDRTWAPLP